MSDRRLRGPILAMSRFLRPVARVLAGPSALGFQLAMLAATRMAVPEATLKTTPSTQRKEGRDAALAPPPTLEIGSAGAVVFRGCIMEGLFDHVNRATERTLNANGFATVAVPNQGCCGGPRHVAGTLVHR